MRSTGILTSMTIITVMFSVYMSGHQVTPETIPLFIKSMHYCMLIFCVLSMAGIFFSAVRTNTFNKKQKS
jgi:hypothetical protein